VLQLRISGDVTTSVAVARRLREIPGARSVLRTEDADGGTALVTADLDTDAADPALDAMRELGVSSPDILLLRLESISVIEHDSILIVGAMAVSPDILPITATYTGLCCPTGSRSARAGSRVCRRSTSPRSSSPSRQGWPASSRSRPVPARRSASRSR
jgi:hypothetical protein